MIPVVVVVGLGFVILMLAWVGLAVYTQRPAGEQQEPDAAARPDPDWLQATYSATTSLYTEVDREIWQVSTIFTSASLIILGWVITSFNVLTLPLIVLAGCGSILLVTVATLFKHRLRNLNLIHIQHLRALEKAGAFPGDPDYWGVHHRRRSLRAQGLMWLTSIHGVMDLYLFAFAALWIALWLYRVQAVGTLPSSRAGETG